VLEVELRLVLEGNRKDGQDCKDVFYLVDSCNTGSCKG
jgi:hypothetical protein